MNDLQKAQKHLNDAMKPWRSFFSARNIGVSASAKMTVLRMLRHLSGGYAYIWNCNPRELVGVSTYGVTSLRCSLDTKEAQWTAYSEEVTDAVVANIFMSSVIKCELHLDMLDNVQPDDVLKAVCRLDKLYAKVRLLAERNEASTPWEVVRSDWDVRDYIRRALRLLYRLRGETYSSSYVRADLFGMSADRSKYLAQWDDYCEDLRPMFECDGDSKIPMETINQLSGVYSDKGESSYVLHLPNQKYSPNLRVEYGKLGKVIRKSCPDISDEEVKGIANTYVAGEVEISNSYEAFEEAYNTVSYGSCMEQVQVNGTYAWEVYVDSPNAAVAILRNANGDMMGRAIVNTDDMQFESVYGNFQLCDKLKKMGYTRTSAFSDGLLIRKITYIDDYDDLYLIAPYIDGDGEYCSPTSVSDDDFMRLGCDGYICLDSTDGCYQL